MENPELLFNRTIQSDKKNKGYGLGLSIVKRLCKQSDIKFEVSSKIGKGTIFYFDLTHHIE